MKELNLTQARDLVTQALDSMAEQSNEDIDGFVILDQDTIQKPWGWVFFYDSRKHEETGDFKYMICWKRAVYREPL